MIRLLCLVTLASSAQASTTVSLTPTADDYLRAAAPSTNYGNAGALVIAGATNANGAFASVMKFDLSTALSTFDAAYGAGNWALTSIALQFTTVLPLNPTFNPNTAGNIATQWIANDAWTETSVNWNAIASLLASGSQSLGTIAFDGNLGTASYALASSAGFANDLSAGSIASLYLSAADPAMSVTLNSRNYTDAGARPMLSLTAVPEPARATLLCCAVMSMFARRRRSLCH